MTVWLDAHLSPRIARWLEGRFGVTASPLRDLGLRDASDEQIFAAARSEKAVMLTKDADFLGLVERLGTPPQVIWLTCGNTSEAALKELLEKYFPTARELIEKGEALVEISGSAGD